MRKCLVVFIALTFVLIIGATAHALPTIVNLPASYANNADYAPIDLYLDAGIYRVDPIGTPDGDFDAWSAWSSTDCADPDGCLQSDGFEGWLNSYVVLSPVIGVLGTIPSTWTVIPGLGYQATSGLVYPTAADALAKAQSSVFYLPTAGIVQFANLDSNSYTNNRGGNSLLVSAVPEPTTLLLLGTGLLGLAGVRRKKFFKE